MESVARGFNPVLTVLALVGFGAIPVFGQEIDPADPRYLAEDVFRADLVVVGTFSVGWSYPWFDGWHYSGALSIEKVLAGERTAVQPIEFKWRETYGATCLSCERMSRMDGERGIWLLTEKSGRWRFSSTAATWCGQRLPMRALTEVERAIRNKRARGELKSGGATKQE